MKWTLKQHFHIESARRLPKLGSSHPCGRIHGHSFKIILSLRGDLDPEAGWMMDYNEIAKAFDPLYKQLDHSYLNDIPGLENPTSELLAQWIFDRLKPQLPALENVSIMETPTTECIYPS